MSHPEPAARFTARSVAGLVAVLAAGAAFGLVLTLVRTRWPPLDHFDRGTAATWLLAGVWLGLTGYARPGCGGARRPDTSASSVGPRFSPPHGYW